MNEISPSLRFFPVPLFASVMGVGGLALALRRAAALWGLPIWLSHTVLSIAIFLFLIITAGYIAKLIRYPGAARADLTHPIKMAFVPTITISILILATGLAPLAPDFANVLWWIGALGHLALTAYVVSSWYIRPDITRDTITPAWLIPIVGNVVTPLAVPRIGNLELAWLSFGVGATFWLALWPMLLNRTLVHDNPIPAKLTPTVAIFIAPPSIIGVSWQSLTGSLNNPVGYILYGIGVFLGILLLLQGPRLYRRPFALPILAYTFPLAALATLTISMATETGSVFHQTVALLTLTLSVIVICGGVGRVTYAAWRKKIFLGD